MDAPAKIANFMGVAGPVPEKNGICSGGETETAVGVAFGL